MDVRLYKRDGSLLSKPPKTGQGILTFDILCNSSIKMIHLKYFLRSVYTDVEDLNNLRYNLENYIPELLGKDHLTKGPLRSGTVLYVWTYLALPKSLQDKGPSSFPIFNRLVPYEVFFCRQTLDPKQIKDIAKKFGSPFLMQRKLFDPCQLPIAEIHGIKCYSGTFTGEAL